MRFLLPLAAAPLGLVLLSACGGEEVAGDEVDAIIDDAIAALDSVWLTAEGEIEADGEDADFTADGALVVDPRAADLNLDMSGIDLHWVFAEDEVFLLGGDGETWVAMSTEDAKTQFALGEAVAGLVDPLAAVEAIGDTVTEASREGEETIVRGDGEDVDVQAYDVTVDAAAYYDALGAAVAEPPEALDHTLWIDSEGRLAGAEIDLGDLGDYTLTITDPDYDTVIQPPLSAELAP